MRTTSWVLAAAAATGLMLSGCGGPASGDDQPTAGSTVTSSARSAAASSGAASPSGVPPAVDVAGTVVTGLEVPWGLAFLPDGSALVAERDSARVVRVGVDGTPTPLGTVPGVDASGEGGLLGLVVPPDDEGTLLAYLSSTLGDNRVVRMSVTGGSLGAPQPVLTGIPHARNHDGGRMVVGPDGNLWIGTGDAGEGSRSQDTGSLAGKILRIGLDGSVPPDNPFPGSPVWSYGHRNVQGLAFDSAGRLWATEFGQNTWDELNLITEGGNYGWPQVEGRGDREGFIDPQVVWATDDASPSGLAIVDDVAYVAGLRGARLWQVPLVGGVAGKPVARLTGEFGRLRTVAPAPGGGLWLTTSNRDGRGDPTSSDDRLLRLTLTPA
jgi:glucose/arabinose dehydrogenase